MARVLVRKWLGVLWVLGLVAGLFGAAPEGASGSHGGEADVDFGAVYGACVGAAAVGAGFEDTAGLLAEEEINCLGHYGITRGRSATVFAPGESVLRWQMALFMARAARAAGIVLQSPADDQGFTDIGSVSEEARNAINGLAGAGIMPGSSGSLFSPNGAVTRGSMAVILDAFLGRARPGPGAFGMDGEEYSDVVADNFNVFEDLGRVSRLAYDAVYRLYEAGVTEGVGDHMFGPGRNVTRAQMAAFIMRALAHTVARPAGVSVQAMKDSVLGADAVELAVSVRDTAFQPVVDAQVDVFRSTEPDDAFGEEGGCVAGKVGKVGAVGVAACEVDGGDELTNAGGDVIGLSVQVRDADVTLWAWTGELGDEFDADEAAARLTVGFSKAASQLLVTDNLEEGQTHLPFGETVAVTLQVADEDKKAVADKGKMVTVAETVTSDDGSTSSSTRGMATDADGKIVLQFTQTDPDAATAGQSASVEITLSNPPQGLPLQDQDGEAFASKTVTWSDEAGVPTTLTVTSRNEFVLASDEGDGAQNAVTAILADQYGNPIRGKQINFFSDTACAPAPDETECDRPGVAAGLSRTTRRNGEANLNYDYDSDDSVIETIWATYEYAGTEGVRGVADDAADRPDDDPDDETALVSERIYFYWVEEPAGAPFTGRILIKDADNDQLAVAAGERVMLVKYDANDQFNNLAGPAVMADFEKDLGDDADPAAVHLTVSRYDSSAGKVSALKLRPEWPGLAYPDGVRLSYPIVAADNGVLVVGHYGATHDGGTPDDDSDDLANAGMAYIYPNGPETAVADIIALQPPSPAENARFGYDVDISGNTVVVGGWNNDRNTAIPGSVYVYVRPEGGVWSAAPTAALTYWGDAGQGVAISDDESTIAMLAPATSPDHQWQIAVMTKPAGGWADSAVGWSTAAFLRDGDGYVGTAPSAPDWLPWDEVGTPPVWERSIAISGDGTVVVAGSCNYEPDFAAPHACPGAVNVWVASGPDGAWGTAREQSNADATLFANGGETIGQAMGKYVAIADDGNTIVASGHFDGANPPFDEPGSMYLFAKPDGGWSALNNDTGSSVVLSAAKGRPNDVFGQYVSISGDGSEAAAGRHWRQEGNRRGSVAVFKRPADGTWVNDGSPDEEFLGPEPLAHVGWQTTYDKSSADLYTAVAGPIDESPIYAWKITR